jgi:hypothetical protein
MRLHAKCVTQSEIIVMYLWYMDIWLPTHQLQNRETPFGFIGSAGHTRARELARNECAEKLEGKVERARGSEIGLDARYEYFRYRRQPTRSDHLRFAAQLVREFEDYQPSTA